MQYLFPFDTALISFIIQREKRMTCMSPKLTIITTSYNSEATIAQALDSVSRQGYKTIEHIICDGASTDGTLDIIAEYKQHQHYPVHVFSEYDKGVYDALNKGVRKARGELIGILHSSDFYTDNAFDIILDLFEEHGEEEAVYRGALRYWSKNSVKLGTEVPPREYSWKNRDINHPAWFIHRRLHEKHGHYDKGFSVAADWDFYIRLLNEGVPFHSTDREITNYRLGGLSSRKSLPFILRKIRQDLRIMEKNGISFFTRYGFVLTDDIIKPAWKILTRKSKAGI